MVGHGGYKFKGTKSGSHQMWLFVQTQAHRVEFENAPRVLHLAGSLCETVESFVNGPAQPHDSWFCAIHFKRF